MSVSVFVLLWKNIIRRTPTTWMFKFKCGYIGQLLIKLGNSSFGFSFGCPFDVLAGITSTNMLMGTQWSLKRAPHFHWCVFDGSYLRYVSKEILINWLNFHGLLLSGHFTISYHLFGLIYCGLDSSRSRWVRRINLPKETHPLRCCLLTSGVALPR